MDGLELRQTMMQALAVGLKALAEERKTANGSYHAELVGRMDATRNMLEFLVNAEVTPCPGTEEKQGPKKDCEECGGECQGHPDSGGEEKEETQ